MHLKFKNHQRLTYLLLLIISVFILLGDDVFGHQRKTNALEKSIEALEDQSLESIASLRKAITSLEESYKNEGISLKTTKENLKTVNEKLNNIKEKLKVANKRLDRTNDNLNLTNDRVKENNESLTSNNGSEEEVKANISTIEKQIKVITEHLQAADEANNANLEVMSKNKEEAQKNLQKVAALTLDSRANISDTHTQKSLIEDNSIRLYELLVKVEGINEELSNLAKLIKKNVESEGAEEESAAVKVATKEDLNKLWALISIILVFLSPLAFALSSNRDQFAALRDGTSHHQGVVLVCLGAFMGYFLIGFSLMYGTTYSGWLGFSNYVFEQELVNQDSFNFPISEFMLYQAYFAMLLALIVYTAVGKLLSATSHLLLALFIAAIVFPIFGHWAWSDQFITGNSGWLESSGFIDEAGASVIHVIAGWFAFMLVWKLGLSRQKDNKKDSLVDFPVYSSGATILLWISWQGFTTGMLPLSDSQISHIMLNNALAASAGGIASFLHYVMFHADKGHITRGLSGFVSGLVAISACSQSVTFMEALAIGAIAGIIQNIAFSLVRKYFLAQDSQIPAAYIFSIHGVGGVWGILCVAIFGTEGVFSGVNFIQLTTQINGLFVAIAYSLILGFIVASIIWSREEKKKYQAERKEKQKKKVQSLENNLT